MALSVTAHRCSTAARPRGHRSPLRWVSALVAGLALALALAALLPSARVGSPAATVPLNQAITTASARYAFDLSSWEVRALAEGVVREARAALSLAALDEAQRRDLVIQDFAVAREVDRLNRQLDLAYSQPALERDEQRVAALRQQLAALDREAAPLSESAAAVVAHQINDHLAANGVGTAALQPTLRLAFPPLTFDVNPPVFFRFQRLPLLLVVAPRDRIAVLDNRFLQPTLSRLQMEEVEAEIDRQGVASLVLPIGGLAAYPSMIPRGTSLLDGLEVVAHEWTHQYLALRPLGQAYFSSYALRSINETVADLAGKEIAAAVFERHYAGFLDAQPASTQAPTLDFGRAMAGIRRSVEALLERGDVVGAEQYMAEQRRWLADNGYHLRKLNTAYLTFYGAYAGSGNPYEQELRRLRAQSETLADFLRRVATVNSERDLDALASGRGD